MALKEISLKVARGEFVALLGPSGCGKTSLLRAIAGFVHPQRGAMRLGGRDVAKVPPRRRNIGLVFQSYALFPHMSVIENVRFGLDSRGVPSGEVDGARRRAMALVGLAGISPTAGRPALGRPAAARGARSRLVIEPDMLLLDEPLARARQAGCACRCRPN